MNAITKLKQKFSELSLRGKFAIACGVPIVLLILLIAISMLQIQSFVKTVQVVEETKDIEKLIGELETGQRGFLITGNESFLSPFNNAKEELKDKIESIKKSSNRTTSKLHLDSISYIINNWYIQAAEPEIELRRKMKLSAKGASFTGRTDQELDVKVADVIDSKMLREFQRIFTEATGIANLVVEKDGKPVKFQTFDEFTEHCFGYMRLSEEGTIRCHANDAEGGKVSAETGKPYVYDCHAGLVDFGVPIILEGVQIGSWLGGQIFVEKPNEAKFRAYAREVGIEDVEGYIKAVHNVPFMSRDRVNAAAEMLSLFARTVSEMGNEKLMQTNLNARIENGSGKRILDKARQKVKFLIEEEKAAMKVKKLILFVLMFVGALISIIISYFFASYAIRLMMNRIGGEPAAIAALVKQVSEGKLDIQQKQNTTGIYEDMQIMTKKLNEIIERIYGSAKNVTSASYQISSIADLISTGANEQAASTEEISSAMEEMVSGIDQNNENTRVAQSLSNKVLHHIEQVNILFNQTLKTMNEIREKVSIINEIAGKTDTLAINASIEAARAGDFGKGFSVVAQEVRKLAEKSNSAANTIDKLSETSYQSAKSTAMQLDETILNIKKAIQLVNEVVESSNEQKAGAFEINNSLQQQVSVTNQSLTTVEQMTESAEELNAQAENLRNALAYFNINGKEDDELKALFKKIAEYLNISPEEIKTPDKKIIKENIIDKNKGFNIELRNEKEANDDDFESY